MAMGVGRAGQKQEEMFYAGEVAQAPAHPFYEALNRVLKQAGFDKFGEEWGFRRRRTLIPGGTRTAFRAEGEQFSERSDAGSSIVQEVFAFVKENLSGAQRRNSAASGERGAGKGAAALVPASAHSGFGARQRYEPEILFGGFCRWPD